VTGSKETAAMPEPDIRDNRAKGLLEATPAALVAVARAVDAVREADVVVLAQASMADAAGRTTTGVPVLSSPRSALRAAADAASPGSPGLSGSSSA
jgi:hypothetical protein